VVATQSRDQLCISTTDGLSYSEGSESSPITPLQKNAQTTFETLDILPSKTERLKMEKQLYKKGGSLIKAAFPDLTVGIS
jgi:hypothetical protein